MEIHQVSTICRCCLQNKGQMKPLYGFSLDEMLRSLTDLEVEPNDGLPELVCFQCVLQLSRAFRFKAQCQKSNTIMLELLKNSTSDVDRDNGQFETFCQDDNEDAFNIEDSQNVSADDKLLDDRINTAEEQKCSTCKKVFESRKKLVRHLKIHSNKTTHKCSYCSKEFSQTANLKRHITLKHTENSSIDEHSCSICEKKFKYASSLFKHIKIHTGKNLLYCPSCPKFFLENTTLKTHLRTHTGDRPFVCSHCSKTFSNSSNFNKHLRSHSDKKPFECNICQRSFAERYYLKHHMNTHDKKQNVLCSECGKSLANAKSLHAHMQLHTKRKTYRCGLQNCDKSFSRPDTAAIHRRIHIGEKPYNCDECGMEFKAKNQLLIHSKNHNIGENENSPENLLKLQTEKYKVTAANTDDDIYNNHNEQKRKIMESSLLMLSLNEYEECSFLP